MNVRVAAVLAAGALALTACGGKSVQEDAAGTAGQDELRVGIFVDNVFGDRDFFDQAGKGKPVLEQKFGAKVTTYEGQLQAQNFEPLLNDAGAANQLVFVLGFEAIDALKKAAAANPDTTYVFVDAPVDDPNVVSAVFRTAEGCFMAGALAGAFTDSAAPGVKPAQPQVGFVGGVDAPVVRNCLTGFQQGATKVKPDVRVLSQYVGSFVDPAKGKEINISMVERNADVTFQYAGLSGEGAFDAAKSGQDLYVIGVVADKSYLAPGKVPGSLLMGVDKVIEVATAKYRDKTLRKGEQLDFGFDNGGWDMVYDDRLVGAETRAKLDAIEAGLADRSITVTAGS
jgi:basic membrane protein A